MSPYSTTSSSSSSSITHEGRLDEDTAEQEEATSTPAEGTCKFLEVPTVADTQQIPDKEGLENIALQTLDLSIGGESQEYPIGEQPITKPSNSIYQEMASPRRVFDVLLTRNSADSDSTGSNESVLQDEPSSPVTETTSSSSRWRSVINGLLHRKNRKSRIRDKMIRRLSTFPPATTEGSRLTQWFAKTKAEAGDQQELKMEGSLMLEKWKPSWRSFSYQELVVATDNFSSEKLIGKGGHAEVYKGCMADGQLVAVKRLMKKDMEERLGDFLSELGVIAHVNHQNAACLLGFGVDGGLHLVLKFSPHGSLASALHGSSEKLGWQTRFKIALGVAEGLLYLHKCCHRRIIHRDIKASNILLTEDYEPQISDFGLAKWLPERWNHHIVFPIEGTFGYLAPEYFMHGVVSEKTDVFAFGVLLLELITGRRAVDSNRQSLVIWAKPLLDAKDFVGLIDPCLEGAYDLEEMDRTVSAASVCTHHLTNVRPYMTEVARLLRGEDTSMLITGSDALKLPASIAGRRPILLATIGDSEGDDYTSSKYLRDLNRHKQLALEQ